MSERVVNKERYRVGAIAYLALVIAYLFGTVALFENLWGVRQWIHGKGDLTLELILHPPIWPVVTLVVLLLEQVLSPDRQTPLKRRALGFVSSLWPVGAILSLVPHATVLGLCLFVVGSAAWFYARAIQRKRRGGATNPNNDRDVE